MYSSRAQELMARETRVTPGAIPAELDGVPVAVGQHLLAGDAFLLRTANGHDFLYRKGHGVTHQSAPGADPVDAVLWLNGSVYAAVASINGLMPLHASAVVADGKVHAFTGDSGAGKSTLVAALAQRGLPLFCDDTLLLDLSDPAQVLCLPGHKRLKLTAEAAALTGIAPREQVASDIDKFFADPPGGVASETLPLAQLIFLEPGAEPALIPVRGGERVMRLQDGHYTGHLFAAARQFDRAGFFTHAAALAARIPMARFVRPFDPARFAAGADFAADFLANHRETA